MAAAKLSIPDSQDRLAMPVKYVVYRAPTLLSDLIACM